MPATQKDVADLVGVSRSVVSYVLHGGKTNVRVSAETAELVRKAAKELDYHPNAMARNFRKSRTGVLGVLLGEARPDLTLEDSAPYFANLMGGMVEGASALGYSVAVWPDLLTSAPESLLTDGRFDGFIWYNTVRSPANEHLIKSCSSPMVFIHADASRVEKQFPAVICDNEGGIKLALEHLADLGHRHVAFISRCGSLSTEVQLRRRHFMSIATSMGMEPTSTDIGDYPNGIRDYLESRPLATALVTHSENYAAQAIAAAISLGISIPADLSIIAFDSTAFCEKQEPKLTAISQPLQDMGKKAAELLVNLIEGNQIESMDTVLPCGLDIRGSTCPAPK